MGPIQMFFEGCKKAQKVLILLLRSASDHLGQLSDEPPEVSSRLPSLPTHHRQLRLQRRGHRVPVEEAERGLHRRGRHGPVFAQRISQLRKDRSLQQENQVNVFFI